MDRLASLRGVWGRRGSSVLHGVGAGNTDRGRGRRKRLEGEQERKDEESKTHDCANGGVKVGDGE